MSESTESIVEALQASWNEVDSDTETEEATAAPENSDQELVADAIDGEDTPTEENEVVAEAEEATQDQEPEGIPAPEHWSSEVKEQFAALSPEAQQILVDRDAEFQKGYQERVQGITEIQQALEPWKQMVAQLGMSEAQAIRTLFATYDGLRNDPLNGIQSLARNFGVLDQLNAPDTDEDVYIDPSVKALKEQVASLQNQLQQFGQAQQQSAQDSGRQMIEDFKSEKDADGKPVHPYFDEALPLITSLVQSGKSLEEAYNEAKWTVPAYREANTPKPTPVSAEEKAAKVKNARRAAKSVKPAVGDAPKEDDKVLSIADELRLAMNETNQ